MGLEWGNNRRLAEPAPSDLAGNAEVAHREILPKGGPAAGRAPVAAVLHFYLRDAGRLQLQHFERRLRIDEGGLSHMA
jgi:hypothetical protein